MISSTSKALTTLICGHCSHQGVPHLQRTRLPQNQLGAYCTNCNAWIKWLPQTSVWLSLEDDQVATPAPAPSYFGTPAGLKNVWGSVITDMAQACYDAADANGWHSVERSPLEICMLIVTECAELAEWYRKGGGIAPTLNPSDHIPTFTGAEEEFADILIRVFDHSIELGIDPRRLGQAFIAKLAYNATRGYRHGGKTT